MKDPDLKNGDGSPPRMRGKPTLICLFEISHRITPAHAGKTETKASHEGITADHPRACGENGYIRTGAQLHDGSPPRMRGKQRHGDGGREYQRITPAHAGKTHQSCRIHCPRTDHPRACGENLFMALAVIASRGSPPRMRGKLQCASQRNPASRITPAHAGKTCSHHIAQFFYSDHPRACGENNCLTE